MLKDITLGQYFPGNSVVHRVDPRAKLLIVTTYIVALFAARGLWAYLLCGGVLVLVVAVARISPRLMIKGLRPILIIVVFTAVLNVFYTPGTVLWSWGFLRITEEGLRNAAYMIARIILLITATSLLTYTTSPIALTDGIERLMNPLKKLKVPVHEFAMMMTIALRFIPTLIEETDKIMSAQKARGADFESGNLVSRAKALVPVLVPLFISAFRRADELATAMECRLYRGGEGRTRLHVLRYTALDAAAFALTVAFAAGVVALRLL